MAAQAWIVLALFTSALMAAALLGLTASGHFPREHRHPALASALGEAVLWVTMASTAVATLVVLSIGLSALPWAALIIAAGGALLFAPLVLQPLPDRIVDGPQGLVGFAGLTVVLTLLTWAAAR